MSIKMAHVVQCKYVYILTALFSEQLERLNCEHSIPSHECSQSAENLSESVGLIILALNAN